jgi:Glucose / Sorbosone dehydrogenase
VIPHAAHPRVSDANIARIRRIFPLLQDRRPVVKSCGCPSHDRRCPRTPIGPVAEQPVLDLGMIRHSDVAARAPASDARTGSQASHSMLRPDGLMPAFLALSFASTASIAQPIEQGDLTFHLAEVPGGFVAPVHLTEPDDGSSRLFVADQIGRIRIIKNGVVLIEPFLDITGRMVTLNANYDERGLLGVAFHPDFASNGRFFVRYGKPRAGADGEPCKGTARGCHEEILAEFRVSASNPDLADPDSEKILIRIPKPQFNHDGGNLAFGPDGYLYFGMGDGGGANDGLADNPPSHGPIGNGQNINTLMGKILRIDVDSGDPYGIPADNASNGAGIKLFTGSNALGEPRRSLLHFDVASAVPAGTTVTKVTLTLFLDKSLSDPGTVSAHRLTADWGEGASNAGDPGGQGVAAAPGDATWNFRFFNATPWTTIGGDFIAVPNASAFQSPFVGSKTWSSDGMLADVQDWLADPASNFGWIVIGEEFLTTTARRYSSRETANAQSRPRLTIEFTPCKVDFDGTGFVDTDDFDAFVLAFEQGS